MAKNKLKLVFMITIVIANLDYSVDVKKYASGSTK